MSHDKDEKPVSHDKDEKLTAVCPACGKNHKPGGKLTEKEQAEHHKG